MNGRIVLAIIWATIDHPEAYKEPDKIKELRSSSFGDGPSREDVNGASWHPFGDEEVANVMHFAPVESLTEVQYRRFSEVILPSVDKLYKSFFGPDIPPLDWIKRNFGHHVAVAAYWRS